MNILNYKTWFKTKEPKEPKEPDYTTRIKKCLTDIPENVIDIDDESFFLLNLHPTLRKFSNLEDQKKYLKESLSDLEHYLGFEITDKPDLLEDNIKRFGRLYYWRYITIKKLERLEKYLSTTPEHDLLVQKMTDLFRSENFIKEDKRKY